MITSSSAVQPLNNLRSAAENIAGPDVKRHHRPLNRETLSSTNLAVGHTIWLLRGMAGHCCRRKRTTAVGRELPTVFAPGERLKVVSGVHFAEMPCDEP